MNKQYYEEYFDLERNHWWFRARKEIIRTMLRKYFTERGSDVLNIGAATGETSAWLGEFGTVTSVEYEKDCVAFVKQKLNLDFLPASITELPFEKDTYGLVCAFDVIEHVEDDKKAVEEMWRVCKPGGIVAVTVPAYKFLWSKHDDINHHVRRYTHGPLKNLFVPLKGSILYSGYFNSLLFAPVAATRVLANLFPSIVNRKGSGSDFSYSGGKMATSFFYPVMKNESWFMKNGIRFPAGISLILLFRKAGA